MAVLGADTARALEGVMRSWQPVERECDVAARIAASLEERLIFPSVLLVGGAARRRAFRHPVPTTAVCGRDVLAVVVGVRGGLNVACSRTVLAGTTDPELAARHHAACAVEAALIAATRPGITWEDALAAGQDAYRDAGFDGEWREHVQGGPIGYLSREFDVMPGTEAATATIAAGTAFAWNPTVRGAKSEDTAGQRIVSMVRSSVRPSVFMTPAGFANAMTVLAAVGGSTNAIIHLCAVAGRRGLILPLRDFGSVSARVPVIVDVAPIGTGLMPDLAAAGGVPTVLAALGSELDLSVPTAAGGSLGESLAVCGTGPARWPVGKPVTSLPAFMVVHGNLAPSGAVIKAAAASPSLLRHRGPAVVFHSYEEMRSRIDDPSLDVTPSSVLVLAGCGPVGMAMPEWGNIPIPSRLLGQGVTDMLRITDGRMSGTGFGTVVLHVAPESAVGGPLSRLRDGDMVSLDAYAGSLSVEADLGAREPVLPAVSDRRGWPVLHRMHVLQAPEGCDYDFLRAETPEQLAFVEPVIGRS